MRTFLILTVFVAAPVILWIFVVHRAAAFRKDALWRRGFFGPPLESLVETLDKESYAPEGRRFVKWMWVALVWLVGGALVALWIANL